MRNLARYIDHTLLRADASLREVEGLCAEAKEHSFASVCVNATYIERCRDLLSSSEVKVGTVIGFPLGASTMATKQFEAEEAIRLGADEIDMVIDIGNVKNERYDMVVKEISSIQNSVSRRAILKVIVETALLSRGEKIKLAEICRDLKVDFIKTSTGFAKGGATVEDIELIKGIVKEEIGIKASGGIKDYDKAVQMIEAGATRLGMSSSVSVVKNSK